MNSFKREQIRKILELPDHQSFSIVRWYSPAEVKPIEATYVMAKLYEPGIGFICIGAAYEHGRFWELDPLKDKPLEIVRVLACLILPWMTVLWTWTAAIFVQLVCQQVK